MLQVRDGYSGEKYCARYRNLSKTKKDDFKQSKDELKYVKKRNLPIYHSFHTSLKFLFLWCPIMNRPNHAPLKFPLG